MNLIRKLRGVQEFSAGAGSLFHGFFERRNGMKYTKESLVDGRARRVFELMGRACDHGVYPCALPLEGHTGPWVQAQGREKRVLSCCSYLGLAGDPRIDEAA